MMYVIANFYTDFNIKSKLFFEWPDYHRFLIKSKYKYLLFGSFRFDNVLLRALILYFLVFLLAFLHRLSRTYHQYFHPYSFTFLIFYILFQVWFLL